MFRILPLNLFWGTISFYNYSFGGRRSLESIQKYHLDDPLVALIRVEVFQTHVYSNISWPGGLNPTHGEDVYAYLFVQALLFFSPPDSTLPHNSFQTFGKAISYYIVYNENIMCKCILYHLNHQGSLNYIHLNTDLPHLILTNSYTKKQKRGVVGRKCIG